MVNSMNISYDSYRVFYYVAKYQNVTQAANRLMNSQPNITRAVKNLEGALGCRLFVRSNRGVRLTPEGEKLYAHIAPAVEHIQAGEEAVAADQSLQSGMVTIAASEIALRCCLLPVLGEYRRGYPGVRIRVSNHSTSQAVAALRDGLADLAVVTAGDDLPKGLSQRRVRDIQEVPVCGEAFSFLRGRALPLEELSQYPLIGLGPDTVSFRFFSRFFSQHQLPFRLDIETAAADQILPFVKEGLGIGFVPEEFLQELSSPTPVQELSLKDPVPKRSILLLKRERQALSAAARELHRMIMQRRNPEKNLSLL